MLPQDWFPNDWIKCTVPILDDPGLTTGNVEGTAFIINSGKVNYAVTAKHVIDACKDPMIGFPTVEKTLERISTSTLWKYLKLEWIYHPTLDIAAIPLKIAPHMDIIPIPEIFWDCEIIANPNDAVIHFGYPDQIGASYADGSIGYFPVGISGLILSGNQNSILTKTKGRKGASGGPLFLKRNDSKYPQLIGIAESIKKVHGKYVDKTQFVPILNIKSVLKSEQMQNQVHEAEKFLKYWVEMKK